MPKKSIADLGSLSGKKVLIRVDSQNGDLKVLITNACENRHSSTEGTGLRNTRRRLQLIYGDKGRLEFICRQSKATVSVQFPASREDEK